eukprot:CAMPEP_0198692904 /NCGR_PEP_ID=MMETSP1468-20131203/238122_1 /TAXON_ID=1461545 /ORGANISM="Mantoniella sp, Strain CCMP1436" /LENGTH=237 /DNA_ID=CAMNT_0044447165 /DNA_START=32 /DNA_END=742 /DNA_ORIENTATION=+
MAGDDGSAAVVLRPQAIINAIGGATGLRFHCEAALKEFDDFFETIGEVAGVLEEAGTSSAKLKIRVTEMLTLQKNHQAHILALGELERTYAGSLDATDFQELLDTKVRTLAAGLPNDPGGFAAEFEKKVADGKRKAPGAAAEEQDEDIMLTSQAGHTTNLKCPITAKAIDEIEEPVVDQKGYVYDKKAITQYINQKGGKAPCPQSGTSHVISIKDLKPARSVLTQRKRAKLVQTANQ